MKKVPLPLIITVMVTHVWFKNKGGITIFGQSLSPFISCCNGQRSIGDRLQYIETAEDGATTVLAEDGDGGAWGNRKWLGNLPVSEHVWNCMKRNFWRIIIWPFVTLLLTQRSCSWSRTYFIFGHLKRDPVFILRYCLQNKKIYRESINLTFNTYYSIYTKLTPKYRY